MESKRNRRLALVAVVLVALAVATAALVFLWPRGLRVGFYDLDPALEAAMKSTVDAWAKGERLPVKYAASPITGLDAKSLRGLDALFLYPSRPNKDRSPSFAPIEPALVGTAALPLRRSVEASARAWALPILADTCELAWRADVSVAGKSPIKARLGQLDGILGKGGKKARAQIVVRGGMDDGLLDFAGLLVLDRGGLSAYEKLADYVRAKGADATAALDYDLGGCSLRSSLDCLSRYGKTGIIHPSWLDFKDADSIACVDASIAGLSVQSLSLHRKEKRASLESWSSAAIAIGSGAGLPVVSASTLCLARPVSGRGAKAVGRLAAYLVSDEGQRALQSSTALAPAAAGAPAVDRQAAEARAAVNGADVLQGFARDGFPSAAARTEFAASLRRYLRSRF